MDDLGFCFFLSLRSEDGCNEWVYQGVVGRVVNRGGILLLSGENAGGYKKLS